MKLRYFILNTFCGKIKTVVSTIIADKFIIIFNKIFKIKEMLFKFSEILKYFILHRIKMQYLSPLETQLTSIT